MPGMVRPLKPIPVFKQEPGETQRRFFNRMETTVQVGLKQGTLIEGVNLLI
jgi:hypothetical protein